MTKLLMLGTGNGGVTKLYNTCFIIQNEQGNFLVDTGGGVEIFNRLKHFNLTLDKINSIFISHQHTDHILGMIWILKKLFKYSPDSGMKINVYCNDKVYEALNGIAKFVLPERLINHTYKMLNFHILTDNENVTINGVNYTFFDIKARGDKQYGFECTLSNKKFIFLGDETINQELYSRVEYADYVTHEAFCLDSEEPIFKAYEKNHLTVKTVCEQMNDLNVKNLILYHTEETHKNRQELYLQEGNNYYQGNLFVPDDLDIIEIL